VLTEALVRRKYTDDQIKLILGENWRRTLDSIWSSPTGADKSRQP
jgi:microsomal dipeptidase-like Zn-dependent dipeptidase